MVYLIVGASSDIGRELIKFIFGKEENATIYAHYNNSKEKLENLCKELSISCYDSNLLVKDKAGVHLIQADLSENDGAAKILKTLPVDEINSLIFLPAYPFNYMRLKDLDIETINKEMQVSVYSFLELAKALVPSMKKLSGVNGNPVSSIFAMLTKYVTDELPPKFMTDYIVSKYALFGAVKSIKAEHGGAKLNVSSLEPDMIETAFLKNIDPRIIEMNREAKGGLLQPKDIAPLIYEKLYK